MQTYVETLLLDDIAERRERQIFAGFNLESHSVHKPSVRYDFKGIIHVLVFGHHAGTMHHVPHPDGIVLVGNRKDGLRMHRTQILHRVGGNGNVLHQRCGEILSVLRIAHHQSGGKVDSGDGGEIVCA